MERQSVCCPRCNCLFVIVSPGASFGGKGLAPTSCPNPESFNRFRPQPRTPHPQVRPQLQPPSQPPLQPQLRTPSQPPLHPQVQPQLRTQPEPALCADLRLPKGCRRDPRLQPRTPDGSQPQPGSSGTRRGISRGCIPAFLESP